MPGPVVGAFTITIPLASGILFERRVQGFVLVSASRFCVWHSNDKDMLSLALSHFVIFSSRLFSGVNGFLARGINGGGRSGGMMQFPCCLACLKIGRSSSGFYILEPLILLRLLDEEERQDGCVHSIEFC